MKDLLDFIIKNILNKGSKYEIMENDNPPAGEAGGSIVTLTVKTSDEDGGMVIGKGGKIIKAIRNILRIKATMEKKKIILLVNPS